MAGMAKGTTLAWGRPRHGPGTLGEPLWSWWLRGALLPWRHGIRFVAVRRRRVHSQKLYRKEMTRQGGRKAHRHTDTATHTGRGAKGFIGDYGVRKAYGQTAQNKQLKP